MKIGWMVLCVVILFGCAPHIIEPRSGVFSGPDVEIAYELKRNSSNRVVGWDVSGVNLTLTNKSSQPIRILWDISSLVLDGRSMRIIHKGVKLAQKDRTQVPTVVQPGSAISDMIVPSEHFSFNPTQGIWDDDPLVIDDRPHRLRISVTYEIESVMKTAETELVISQARTTEGGSSKAY